MPKLRADPPPNSRRPVTVRAVHPNAGVHAWYQQRLDWLLRDMHADVTRGVLAAYGVVEPVEIAKDAPTPRNPSLFIKRALEKYGRKWTLRLDKLSLSISREFAKKSFKATEVQTRAAFKDAGFTITFAPTPGSMAAYQAVVAENVNLIKSIPAQYLKDVQSNVWQAVMRGSDLHALSATLQETYGVSQRRAALIARDQNAKAKAVIERTRRQELGITHAIWQHSAGGKVPRATHVAMSGKAYPLSQGMYDSAEGRYVLPGELINCRCTSRAVVPAFETISQARARQPANTPLLNAARARAR